MTWSVVGESVKENRTVENLEALFAAGKELDIPVFVSPHYYYPTTTGGSSRAPSNCSCTTSTCSIGRVR